MLLFVLQGFPQKENLNERVAFFSWTALLII